MDGFLDLPKPEERKPLDFNEYLEMIRGLQKPPEKTFMDSPWYPISMGLLGLGTHLMTPPRQRTGNPIYPLVMAMGQQARRKEAGRTLDDVTRAAISSYPGYIQSMKEKPEHYAPGTIIGTPEGFVQLPGQPTSPYQIAEAERKTKEFQAKHELNKLRYELDVKKFNKEIKEGAVPGAKLTGRVKEFDDYATKFNVPKTEENFKKFVKDAYRTEGFTQEDMLNMAINMDKATPDYVKMDKTLDQRIADNMKIINSMINPPQQPAASAIKPPTELNSQSAAQHKGRLIEDSQGKRYRSDGVNWIPQ